MSDAIEQWSKNRAEDCARCEGILAAMQEIGHLFPEDSRTRLLKLATEALSGDWRKKKTTEKAA